VRRRLCPGPSCSDVVDGVVHSPKKKREKAIVLRARGGGTQITSLDHSLST